MFGNCRLTGQNLLYLEHLFLLTNRPIIMFTGCRIITLTREQINLISGQTLNIAQVKKMEKCRVISVELLLSLLSTSISNCNWNIEMEHRGGGGLPDVGDSDLLVQACSCPYSSLPILWERPTKGSEIKHHSWTCEAASLKVSSYS